MNYRIELCPSKENYSQVKRIMLEKENYAQEKRIMLKKIVSLVMIVVSFEIVAILFVSCWNSVLSIYSEMVMVIIVVAAVDVDVARMRYK